MFDTCISFVYTKKENVALLENNWRGRRAEVKRSDNVSDGKISHREKNYQFHQGDKQVKKI